MILVARIKEVFSSTVKTSFAIQSLINIVLSRKNGDYFADKTPCPQIIGSPLRVSNIGMNLSNDLVSV